MNPTDRNKVTQTTIHTPAQVVSVNIIPHQGYSGTNQGKNEDDQRNAREKNQRSRFSN